MVILTAASLAALSGCTKIGTGKTILDGALYRTTSVARTFSYAETAGGTQTEVSGAIADDYRYQLAATINQLPAEAEVVDDDARALQVGDSTLLTRLTSPGAPVPSPLTAGQWVVDPTGASQLFSAGQSRPVVGTDPVYDALDVIDYVRAAIAQSAGVELFDPEATNYRKQSDPFPKPKDGVLRYDVDPPAVPQVDAITAQGGRPLDTRYFRRMSIYVHDGMVVEIREEISVLNFLEDPRSELASRISEYGFNLPNGPPSVQATFLANALDALDTRLGLPAVRERDLDVTFSNLGAPPTVTMPAGASTGSLAGIGDYGQILSEQAT